jgi:hypothetical protein
VKLNSCTLFGLTIRSEIPLPELNAIPDIGALPADVEIHQGTVDMPSPSVDFLDMRVSVQPEFTTLDIPSIGRFQVVAGKQVIVDAFSDCPADKLRIYLLGSAFGALLHQRGMLPLHANAIEVDGQVFAFVGPSGAGKSTLAAYFNDRGYRVLCDDVCAVSFSDLGTPLAWPGLPRLKLWADALEARGQTVYEFRKITSEHPKYHFPVRSIAMQGPFPLARIYDLAQSTQDAESSIKRISGADALNTVLSNIYRRRLAELSTDPRRHLKQVAALIKHAQIYLVQRRWGYAEFSAEAEKLESHLKS